MINVAETWDSYLHLHDKKECTYLSMLLILVRKCIIKITSEEKLGSHEWIACSGLCFSMSSLVLQLAIELT